MTDDPIHNALAVRADEHERTLVGNHPDQPSETAPLTLHTPKAQPGRENRRVLRVAAAAAALAIVAIAGGIFSGSGTDDAPVGSTGASLDDGSQGSQSPTGPSIAAFTEAAARAHLESFLTALDRRDFPAAVELLGGDNLARSVADVLRLDADDRLVDALERHCTQERTFCTGLTVGEPAASEETLRAFLVTTPIPRGSLGGGEPAEVGVEHSTPFRVEWVNGSMRVLDLPPIHDDATSPPEQVALDVLVLNGSGRCGIAGDVADAVRRQPFAARDGLGVLPPANAWEPAARSTVYAGPDARTPAERIAVILRPEPNIEDLTPEIFESLLPNWIGPNPAIVILLGEDQAAAWPGC
jgi:LytR cell envelope-related transcriptional attenuator